MPDEAPVITTNGLEVVDPEDEAIVADLKASVEQMKDMHKAKKTTTR
jgi:hypothetical protein